MERLDKVKQKNSNAKPVTLSNQLIVFLRTGDSDGVDDMKNTYKI